MPPVDLKARLEKLANDFRDKAAQRKARSREANHNGNSELDAYHDGWRMAHGEDAAALDELAALLVGEEDAVKCPHCANLLKQRASDIAYMQKLEAELARFRKVEGFPASVVGEEPSADQDPIRVCLAKLIAAHEQSLDNAVAGCLFKPGDEAQWYEWNGENFHPCPDPAFVAASPRVGVPAEKVYICERCQMRLPERLMTFGIGVRGGHAAWCAACRIHDCADWEAKRAEVIALRKAHLLSRVGAASPEKAHTAGAK